MRAWASAYTAIQIASVLAIRSAGNSVHEDQPGCDERIGLLSQFSSHTLKHNSQSHLPSKTHFSDGRRDRAFVGPSVLSKLDRTTEDAISNSEAA